MIVSVVIVVVLVYVATIIHDCVFLKKKPQQLTQTVIKYTRFLSIFPIKPVWGVLQNGLSTSGSINKISVTPVHCINGGVHHNFSLLHSYRLLCFRKLLTIACKTFARPNYWKYFQYNPRTLQTYQQHYHIKY